MPTEHKVTRRSFVKVIASIPAALLLFDQAALSATQSIEKGPSLVSSDILDPTSWGIVYGICERQDYGTCPLQISYVVGYIGKGSWRRKIGVQNISHEPIRSAEFSRVVFDERQPRTPLETFKGPTFKWSPSLCSGAEWELDGKDDLARMFEAMLKDGVLQGHYRIAVGIEEVSYGSGEHWYADGSWPSRS